MMPADVWTDQCFHPIRCEVVRLWIDVAEHGGEPLPEHGVGVAIKVKEGTMTSPVRPAARTAISMPTVALATATQWRTPIEMPGSLPTPGHRARRSKPATVEHVVQPGEQTIAVPNVRPADVERVSRTPAGLRREPGPQRVISFLSRRPIYPVSPTRTLSHTPVLRLGVLHCGRVMA